MTWISKYGSVPTTGQIANYLVIFLVYFYILHELSHWVRPYRDSQQSCNVLFALLFMSRYHYTAIECVHSYPCSEIIFILYRNIYVPRGVHLASTSSGTWTLWVALQEDHSGYWELRLDNIWRTIDSSSLVCAESSFVKWNLRRGFFLQCKKQWDLCTLTINCFINA